MKDSLWYRQTTNRANRLIEKLGKSAWLQVYYQLHQNY
jgi:hypothetical protein